MFRQLKGASGQGGSQGGAASGSNSCPSNSRKSGGGGGPPPRAPGALGGGCRYPHRVCSQPPLDHYEYCIKHILEDKNAPYKPCGYTYASNNKRCLQPAARGDKRDIGYCAAHLWKTQLKRQRSMAKYVPPVTREALLAGLAHYVRPIRGVNKNASSLAITSGIGASGDGDDSTNPSLTRALDPFVEADVSKAGLWRAHVLECASESDSDVEPANHDTVWSATNEDSSDAESIDSTMDDPIRHAAMYTAEEVVTITRNKQMRLQKLYKRQFDRLIHVLRERRRNCLHGLKKEKETHCPIYDKGRVSAKEQKVYDKLKALNGYQKRSPTETVAYIANLEKRAKEKAGANYKPTGHNPKCTFTEGGVRCAKATLPLTKFCFKHILDDPNQLIFKACGCRKPDSTECRETICSNLSSSETCLLHIRLPQLPHLNLLASLDDDNNIKKEDGATSIVGGGAGRGVGTIKVAGGGGGGDESEFDASATESAFSTDNPRESPDASRDHSPEGPPGITSNLNRKGQQKMVEHEEESLEISIQQETVQQEEIVVTES